MECPHFAGVFMKYCVAEKEVYVPTIYEMREQCKHLQHKGCRHYMCADSSSGEQPHAPVACDNGHPIEIWDVR